MDSRSSGIARGADERIEPTGVQGPQLGCTKNRHGPKRYRIGDGAAEPLPLIDTPLTAISTLL
jgi:hypothetical protein